MRAGSLPERTGAKGGMRSDRGVCNESERGRDKAEEERGEGGGVEERKTGRGRLAAESWLGYADWDGWVD